MVQDGRRREWTRLHSDGVHGRVDGTVSGDPAGVLHVLTGTALAHTGPPAPWKRSLGIGTGVGAGLLLGAVLPGVLRVWRPGVDGGTRALFTVLGLFFVLAAAFNLARAGSSTDRTAG